MQAVITQMIGTIQRRCEERGLEISQALAGAMVRKVVLDPAEGFELDKELREDDVGRVVERSVALLGEADSPEVDTLKLSLAFDALSHENPVLLAALGREKGAEARRKVLLDAVLKSKARGLAALSALYRKILDYVVSAGRLEEGGGSGSGEGEGEGPSEAMLRESNAALESIFPHSELPAFVMLSAGDKTAQLNEMAKIVVGILLYNRSIGKGGSSVTDLPANLLGTTGRLREDVSGAVDELASRIADYTALLNHMQFNNARLPVSLDRLNGELANRRSLLGYMESLLETASSLKATVNSTIASLNSNLDAIHAIVVAKHAVPTETVYPRFVEVFHIWDALSTLALQADSLALVFAQMETFMDSFQTSLDPTLVAQANDALAELTGSSTRVGNGSDSPLESVVGDSKAGEHDDGSMMVMTTGIHVSPSDVPPMGSASLGLSGYCPWTLVYRNAMLLPGDPRLGAVLYRGVHYLCVDEAALSAFQAHPEKYLVAIQGMVEEDPMLGKHVGSLTVLTHGGNGGGGGGGGEGASSSASASGVPPKPASVSVGIQTEVHPNPPPKDPNYEWNEWNLRRKALMYVSLRTKATHSTQTFNSAYRADASTQHYVPKDAKTQTAVDASTSVHPVSRYVAGLRGRPEGTVGASVVDLTLPVNIP